MGKTSTDVAECQTDKSNLVKKDLKETKVISPKASLSCDSTGTCSYAWWTAFVVITALAIGTRFHKVTEPNHVVWDETHFGKFGSWYINQTFFFDVHPPLGKMMIGAFGYLSGYDGAFPFDKPGDKYENVSYIGMRLACTGLGSALVPLTYLSVWEMTQSLPAAIFSSVLILADNGLLTLCQYILLDPLMLFFIMASVFAASKFSSSKTPFSLNWWSWMVVTGVCLSGAISVKFVGVFVVIWVGLLTISQLYEIFGDLSVSMFGVLKQFLARVIGLILIPCVLYVCYYYIHFSVLTKSGSGDGFYSSVFQTTLEGNELHDANIPLQLAYGSVVTIKSAQNGGGYLHSHGLMYPSTDEYPPQQQITTYGHNDNNNKWEVKPFDSDPLDWHESNDAVLVKHGDQIRLEHVNTGRNLHSHMEKAPITMNHMQVSAYGENGDGDRNDFWIVEVVGGKEGDPIETIASNIKLVHKNVECALHLSGKQLPAWASEQGEVTCNRDLNDVSNHWNIEGNEHPHVKSGSLNVYSPGFFQKFFEAHEVMLKGNSGLKPKEGEVTSKPWEWPILHKGQWFSAIDGYKVYLLGNPIIWWGNLVLMGVYLLVWLAGALAEKRAFVVAKPTDRRVVNMTACHWMMIAWTLHYVPFFFMGRILYYHHYFPALLFSSMMSGMLLDYLTHALYNLLPDCVRQTAYLSLCGGILLGLAYSFQLFTPLCYGMTELGDRPENATFAHLRWVSSWEF